MNASSSTRSSAAARASLRLRAELALPSRPHHAVRHLGTPSPIRLSGTIRA